ncbi:CAP domain-containing protein [Massilia sp. CFBP9012]|uniref:CAP domain-containing protein n=1 Tax=Massilia sp. CFBP9012 TaxID=3096531 RepID=UPI002A6B719C|nr:CAP domain-containing protein [Massilia sp. CFBP9012]MDY0976872.1 CAP domain-containing protein [Massilia sp. CFBP9012]
MPGPQSPALRQALLTVAATLLALPATHALPTQAGDSDSLATLVNAYRANPGACDGLPAAATAALDQQPALAQVRIGAGTFIESALEQAGYAVAQAQAVYVTGPEDAQAAMNVLAQKYCKVLLSDRFSAVGSYREGTTWTVVLARPAPPLPSATYPDWREAGRAILIEVNAARASARSCGKQAFPAAPPLSWNPALGDAALAHSRDMATGRYFSHRAKDGSQATDRALRAGYSWRRVGENIAFGQRSPREAVEGWLDSPGHCANIMNRDFTEMGAAYGVTPERQTGIIYWTQVFAAPR